MPCLLHLAVPQECDNHDRGGPCCTVLKIPHAYRYEIAALAWTLILRTDESREPFGGAVIGLFASILLDLEG